VPPVELCLDERPDLDAVDHEPVDDEVDVGATEQHAGQARPGEVDLADDRARRVEVDELPRLSLLLCQARHASRGPGHKPPLP
jgi:hypothetical protein